MKETDKTIMAAVKFVVAREGMDGLSTRSLGREAGVNSGLMYHYFNTVNEVKVKAFCLEWQGFVDSVLQCIDDVEDIPFSRRDKIRLCFHRIRKELLEQQERTVFLSAFRSSSLFPEAAEEYERQLDRMADRLELLFPDDESCRLSLRCLLAILLDSAAAAVQPPEEPLFELWYRLIS